MISREAPMSAVKSLSGRGKPMFVVLVSLLIQLYDLSNSMAGKAQLLSHGVGGNQVLNVIYV